MLSLFYLAAPLSGMLGGPISGGILKGMAGVPLLSGWQWMFLIEAAPALVLGFVVFYTLKDRIPPCGSWARCSC